MNLALLCQKEELFGEALKWCEKALQEQPANAKAVYRQAQVCFCCFNLSLSSVMNSNSAPSAHTPPPQGAGSPYLRTSAG